MKIVMILLLVILLVVNVWAGELQDVFLKPPHDALPRGYWIWAHGNFDYATIKKELQAYKSKGLGGVDIFDIGVSDRREVIPTGPGFMSSEQVDGIAFALAEAKTLGLKVGLIASSSWNAGGVWTPLEYAIMNLVAWSDTVKGPIQYSRRLPFPDLPGSFSKPYGKFPLSIPKDKNGLPQYYQEIAVFAFPVDMNGKITALDQVQLLSGQIKEGTLNFQIPQGRWVILRTVSTNFGQQLWLPSDHSQGLTMDHFSKQATRHHFQTIIDRLETRIGPLKNTALERLYLASYESDADVIWTPSLVGEFYQRNGYRLEPFIPALFGFVIRDTLFTNRFLYDYRKTVSDLFVENLYREARDLCHEKGLLICSEAGGPGPPLHHVPTEDLKALGSVDVMRGEFWNREIQWNDRDGFDLVQVVKSIASAAHIYGHKIVEMESFTSHINWEEGPSVFKPLADRAFCEGMNRVVYHTMAHNPPEAGVPGWSYQAGTHMNTNLTWWDMSDQLHAYIARCSALLQQGRFVADACYYYGHDIPNFAKPKHVRPALGPGYDYDDINTEVLLTMDVRDGCLVLQNGMAYRVLVLPNDEHMDWAVLQKIDELLKKGGTIIGPKPQLIYGLVGYPADEIKLRELADLLWGKSPAKKPLERKIGKGTLILGHRERDVLRSRGIAPDVEIFGVAVESVDFIHRSTEQEEIYFIRNTKSNRVRFDARFRVKDKQPELWDPLDGTMQVCAVYAQEQEGIRLPLCLEPYGSIFVVFTGSESQARYIKSVRKGQKNIFPLVEKFNTTPISAVRLQKEILFCADSSGTFQLVMSDGTPRNSVIGIQKQFTIDGAWDVRFPHGWGALAVQKFDSLYSWTESSDEGTRTFSGTATYRKTFSLPADYVCLENVLLDLGEVKEIARAYLNGHELGISSFIPHEFDVSKIIRPGDNFLVVQVANTWLNRLVADDKKPPEFRSTNTNLTEGPKGNKKWREGIPKPSGLLGPVRLITKGKALIE